MGVLFLHITQVVIKKYIGITIRTVQEHNVQTLEVHVLH